MSARAGMLSAACRPLPRHSHAHTSKRRPTPSFPAQDAITAQAAADLQSALTAPPTASPAPAAPADPSVVTASVPPTAAPVPLPDASVQALAVRATPGTAVRLDRVIVRMRGTATAALDRITQLAANSPAAIEGLQKLRVLSEKRGFVLYQAQSAAHAAAMVQKMNADARAGVGALRGGVSGWACARASCFMHTRCPVFSERRLPAAWAWQHSC